MQLPASDSADEHSALPLQLKREDERLRRQLGELQLRLVSAESRLAGAVAASRLRSAATQTVRGLTAQMRKCGTTAAVNAAAGSGARLTLPVAARTAQQHYVAAGATQQEHQQLLKANTVALRRQVSALAHERQVVWARLDAEKLRIASSAKLEGAADSGSSSSDPQPALSFATSAAACIEQQQQQQQQQQQIQSRQVWDCAVSLAWLLRFAETQVPDGYTTLDVTEKIVKPATLSSKCRYVDLIDSERCQGARHVGASMFFVSHRWGMSFKEQLVHQLREHFKEEEEETAQARDNKTATYVWLDIFAVNQHGEGTTQADDLANLQAVIQRSPGGTLLVLEEGGLVLTRIWCLYEIWQTAHVHKQALQLLLHGLDADSLEKVFIDLDVRKAQATVQADRLRILEDIEASMGGAALNFTIKDAMVASAVRRATCKADVAANKRNKRLERAAAKWLTTAGQLARFAGKLSEAEPLYRRALDIFERVLGPDHPTTAASSNNLAVLLEDQGKLHEAEPLLRRALEVYERVLGPDHPRTANSCNNLATLLEAQGKLSEAEPLLRRALEVRERVLGPDHPHTAASCNNMAALLNAQGKLSETEPLYRRALEMWERVLGPDHPSTTTSCNNLALLLQAQGKLSEAEPLYRRALEVRKRVLGPDHPDTASSMYNLATLLQDQGKLGEAEPLYRRALDVWERVLGPDHPRTASSMFSFAILLKAQGKLSKAEARFARELDVCERTLGKDHEDTVASRNNLARLRQAMASH